MPVGLQDSTDRFAHPCVILGADEPGAQHPKHLETAFADDAFRFLTHDTQHSADAAIGVVERAVGEAVVGFLGVTAAHADDLEAAMQTRTKPWRWVRVITRA